MSEGVTALAAPPPPAASSSADRACSEPASPNSSATTAERPQHLQAGMPHPASAPQSHAKQAPGQQLQAGKASKRGNGSSSGSGSGGIKAKADKKHHLLRHSVTDEARAAAVERFCGGDAGRAEEGAAGIWKLQQKDLRTAFEAVYGTPTSSCNNGWMRGKLLQALGLSSHWQSPREAPPSPAAPELPPVEAEPGAEVSRFGRRVRRRKYEGSDFDESGEETWVDGSPSPRAAAAVGGSLSGSMLGSARPAGLLGVAPKRPRTSAAGGGSPRGSPPLGSGPVTVVTGSDWRGPAAQPWQPLAGVAGASAPQGSAEQHVKIVVRQVFGQGDLRERSQAVVPGPAAPPPPPPHHLLQPSEALAFAARFAGSRSASPSRQEQAAAAPPTAAPPPPLRLPSSQLQHPAHPGSAQMQRSASAGPASRTLSGLLPQESTNLRFYEQQQRLYRQRRQEWEQKKKREIRHRLAVLQGRQAAAAYGGAPSAMAPPPAHQMPLAAQPAGAEHPAAQPMAAQPVAARCMAAPPPAAASQPQMAAPQAAAPPAEAPCPVQISSMGHLSAQEWAQHILPLPPQPPAGPQQPGLMLQRHVAAHAYGRADPSPSPFAADASAGLHPQLLAAAGRPHQPAGLPRSLSQELHGLYSAWHDGQLSLSAGLGGSDFDRGL
ncbi:hypothetical protein ABPG75_005809 [Micractinium tetrahymenae]